jgi:uncharacterized membrane protein YcaP (DUF421 family)
MFFSSWAEIGRVVLVSIIVFIVIVVMLRVVGQEALAKMSGYDVVFTVSLGSIVATVVLTPSLTVSDAVAAFATLIAIQELTRWLQSRSLLIHHSVREKPRVVVWDGQLLEDRLREISISADEVRAAIRKMGLSSISDVRAVVLENDGQWSVIPNSEGSSDESAFFGLPIPGREHSNRGKKDEGAVPASPTRTP